MHGLSHGRRTNHTLRLAVVPACPVIEYKPLVGAQVFSLEEINSLFCLRVQTTLVKNPVDYAPQANPLTVPCHFSLAEDVR